jgi:hypothetical protein
MSTKEIATTAKRREGIHATLKAATEAWAGPGILILLFLASLAYVAFGGTLALEASPVPEPETSIAGVTVITADAGGVRRNERISGNSATPADYFPAGYRNRGRDDDGNVMRYEHD